MRRSMPYALLLLAAAAAAGCPATTTTTAPPPVDVRAVQLAQAPAETEFVVQADLARVLEPAVVQRWVGWVLQSQGITVDPACALALLGRAQILTEAMIGVNSLDEEAMVLVSGDLAAADVAGCVALLLDGEAPAPDAEGVYTFDLGREVVQLADLSAGGVVLASPAAMSLARGPAAAAEASLAGAPAYQQLRSLLAAGPADLELFVTKPMDVGDFGFQGVGATLQRGTTDRYEVVILAADADAANATAMFVATLPLVLAGLEAQLGAAAGAGEEQPLGGEAMAEALGVVAAAREALTAAQTTVEGNVVRVVLELDPTRASPVQLLIVGGVVLLARSAPAPVPPPPPEVRSQGDDYVVPGVSGSAVDAGQPPVE